MGNAAQRSFIRDSPWFKSPQVYASDQRIFIPVTEFIERIKYFPEEQFDDFEQQEIGKELRIWIVKVYGTICSDAYNKFSKGELTTDEVKSYTAKNLLLNIGGLVQELPLAKNFSNDKRKKRLIKFLADQSIEVIKQLILKYPQAEITVSNRKLEKQFQLVNQLRDDTYDMIQHSSVQFQYKQGAEYSSEILKLLNHFIGLTTEPYTDEEMTKSEVFDYAVKNICQLAGCKNFQQHIFKSLQKVECNHISAVFDGNSANSQIWQKHRQEVTMGGFLCKRGFKVGVRVDYFSKQEVDSGMFRLKDSSILRVLTKWAEQLRAKIRPDYYRGRTKFKSINGYPSESGQTPQLLQFGDTQMAYFAEAAAVEDIEITQYYEQMKRSFLLMSFNTAEEKNQGKYTDPINTNIGIFSARIQACIGQSVFKYVSKLIHSLLKIPIEAAKKMIPSEREKALKVSLVTFKISDLLRAKCRANERHIVSVYQLLKNLSQKCPNFLKIIRTKNRLETNNNDILINLLFRNQVICEMQLSVTSNISKRQQDRNTFNHFIYQLQRAQFGPVAECACIITQYDPVVKHYTQRESLGPPLEKPYVDPTPLSKTEIDQIVKRSVVESRRKSNSFPFICSSCKKFQRNSNPDFFHNRIHCDEHIECNECYVGRIVRGNNNNILLRELLRKDTLSELFNQKQFRETTPKQILRHLVLIDSKAITGIGELKHRLRNGFLINKNGQKPNPRYFSVIHFNSEYYMVSRDGGQGNSIHVIFNFKTDQKKSSKWNDIVNNYYIIIFEKPLLWEYPFHIDQKSNDLSEEWRKSGMKAEEESMINDHDCKICCSEQLRLARSLDGREVLMRINSVIMQNLNKQKENVTQFTLSNHYLTTQLRNIKHQFTLVQAVFISNNMIPDIAFVKFMPQLKKIHADRNKITSVAELSYCQNLTEAYFNDNQLKSLNGMQKCLQLKILSVDRNKIVDLQPLSRLKKLIQLSCNKNLIHTLQNIGQCSSLQELRVKWNRLQSLEGLKGAINLNKLHCNQNFLTDLEGLRECPSLKELYCGHNRITQLSGLEQNLQIYTLQIGHNEIQKLGSLHHLKFLTKLSAQKTLIQSLRGLEACPSENLLQIDVSNNEYLERLDGIQNSTSLEVLIANNCSLTSLEGLENCVRLKTLEVNKNRLETLRGLENCSQLKKLDCNDNNLSSFLEIRSCIRLRTIAYVGNPVVSTEVLEKLPRLSRTDIGSRQTIQTIDY